MKILHIACGFSYSNIYRNLFDELTRKKIDIEVYVPQHVSQSISEIDHNAYSYYIYSNQVINRWDKYIYFTKINKMQRDIEKKFNLSSTKLMHAHSLFSDGGVAYKLYKKYNIPFIVAVRDTDVNQYFKKAKHLKLYALKILKSASAVVFLSKAYKESVIERFVPSVLQPSILKKSVVIPNGISDFWLQNVYYERPKLNIEKKEISLIFVGQIIKRKNIESILKAKKEIYERTNKKVKITLVGNKKDDNYFNYLSSIEEFLHIEHCSSNELINYYRESDIFVMPSLTETFGLVYAEALTQGLPVIYTKGQGFDGQFEEGAVGYGINPLSTKDLTQKIQLILEDYDLISRRCLNNCTRFDWDQITDDYIDLYSSASINGNNFRRKGN